MSVRSHVAFVAACFLASPAFADLPGSDPTQLDAPFAIENTNYNDPTMGVGPVGRAYGFHFGVGSATSTVSYGAVPPTNPPTFVPHVVAHATVAIAGYPYLDLLAANPMDTAGSAYAHGELRYQYLLTVAKPVGLDPALNTTFENVATITGVSHIHTEGLSTNLSLTASAPGNISFDPITAVYADGSSDVAYVHDQAFTVGAPGQYVGTTTVGGTDYLNYKGTLSLYATVFGETHVVSGMFMGAPINTTVNNHPGATGTILLDPLISFNQDFLTQNGLTGGTVTLSPGVANASAPSGAPEPAAWALLIVGFGLTGAIARRRRLLAVA